MGRPRGAARGAPRPVANRPRATHRPELPRKMVAATAGCQNQERRRRPVPRRTRLEAVTNDSERPDAADGRGAAESGSRDERGAAGQPGSEANAAAGARAARPGPASAAGGRGTQQGAPGTAPAPAPGGATAGAGPVREGAGGVRGGALSGNSGSPDPASLTPGTSTRAISPAALARARDVAEAAIAHDEVPPRHRAYVREYYRAVSRLNEP